MKKEVLDFHKRYFGKTEVKPKFRVSKNTLKLAYTPGVADVVSEIAKNKDNAYLYTAKKNSVAIVTDGTAVLGMGHVGAEAAIPVMEGKAVLFKEFADIDAVPICVHTQDENEIVELVKNISPRFGGIVLEDIDAPKCFEIEERLQDIGIPVVHDDQHGTAIAVYSTLLNATKVLKKDFEELKVVISGAGAAGTAVAKMLVGEGFPLHSRKVKDLIVVDSKGAIYSGRELTNHKEELAKVTNKNGARGNLAEILKGADAFIGLSRAGVLKGEMIKQMNKDPIIFALANPTPEIFPDEAKKAGAAIVATGRSDFPNQVNNILVLPGLFRGALNKRIKQITPEMKMAAALKLASLVKKPTRNKVVVDLVDKRVVKEIAKEVEKFA